jgi:TM2 domain-containing membrane protein YozV
MKAHEPRPKSKLLATWIALAGGSFGLHRFYLHGLADPWGWCSLPPTLLGLYGLQRARLLGLDDHLSWVLLPLFGLMLAAGMLAAIVYGLTPDEKWNARFDRALALGAAALMATIAFSAQRFFEFQAEQAAKTAK